MRAGTPTVPCGGGNPTNGGKQFICPQCAGKVATTAKTRMARTTNSDGPFLPIEDEYCCLGPASVSLALLDSFQRIPYGTLAWKQSYGRRNIIEKSNATLKDKGGLQAGWCRAFGLAAHTIGALALAVVHNLRETKRLLSRQKRNGATPEPALNGTVPASTAEESPPNTLSTRDRPKRQPARSVAPTVTPTVGFSAPGKTKTGTPHSTTNLPERLHAARNSLTHP